MVNTLVTPMSSLMLFPLISTMIYIVLDFELYLFKVTVYCYIATYIPLKLIYIYINIYTYIYIYIYISVKCSVIKAFHSLGQPYNQ